MTSDVVATRERRAFEQVPLAALPEHPVRPHPYFDAEVRSLRVWTREFGDVDLSYRVWGSGPPLLLVHGLMTSSYSWRYALEPLGQHYTLYVVDMPGAGSSSMPAAHYAAEALSDVLAAFIDSLRLGPCSVVGNSMGGYICMWLAMRRPSLVKKLVNLHSPGVPTPRMWALWAAIRIPGAQAALKFVVARNPERWVHRNVHYFDESLKSLEEIKEYARPLHTAEGRNAFVASLRDTLDPFAFRRFAASLHSRRNAWCDFPVPLMLMYARQDPMVPPEVGRMLGAMIPAARFVWLEDASHFAHVDAIDRFAPSVLAFLARE